MKEKPEISIPEANFTRAVERICSSADSLQLVGDLAIRSGSDVSVITEEIENAITALRQTSHTLSEKYAQDQNIRI